ncbi:MAG: hypothetical protein ABIS38_08365 [Sphingomicrobium sp.]
MRDRDLVRLYWPVALRPAFDALFAIDDALGEVVASASQPALGAIKLAWWREALERLDHGPPPAEPRLQAVAAQLLPRGISGASLAAAAAGWATLLDESPDCELVEQRGIALFGIGARLLGADDPELDDAGRLFAVIDVARRRGDDHLRASARGLAAHRFAREVRPLTALAALAARDRRRGTGEPEGTPGRALTLLRHRLSGWLPRH